MMSGEPMSPPSTASRRRSSTGIKLAVIAPLDEFSAKILSERRGLFALALGFVLGMLPLAIWLGSMLARSLRLLQHNRRRDQHFLLADRPRLHSVIDEIDDLDLSGIHDADGHSAIFKLPLPRPIVHAASLNSGIHRAQRITAGNHRALHRASPISRPKRKRPILRES